MCEKCERRSKNLGLPKGMTFGQVKVFAIRMLAGEPIPLFKDMAANLAIEAHVSRIERARKRGKRKGR